MAKLFINEKKQKGHINPEIYGHFSEHLGRCIYEGLYVGENSEIPNIHGMRKDVVDALKDMKIPVLRWPGGCFADEYHWKDGIGPKESRKKMVNTNWGGVTEDNSFGTHEFFELCEQLGCKTYINGNVGSGTVQEMSEWIEYMTFDGVSPMAELRKQNGHEKPWKVDYFGVGNENWGCGGNMTPEYYGNLYRRYQTFVRNYAGNGPIQKICCGANSGDYAWTKDVLATCYMAPAPEHAHGFMEGLSLHYYTLPEDDWKLPRLTVADVAVELQRPVLGQHAHSVDTGVGAVGQGKINDAELPAKGYRRLCHVAGKHIQPAPLSAGQKHGDTFFFHVRPSVPFFDSAGRLDRPLRITPPSGGILILRDLSRPWEGMSSTVSSPSLHTPEPPHWRLSVLNTSS